MSKENLEEEKSFTSEAIDFFKDLVIIVIVVKIITVFLVSIFIINGQSMYSSYYDKEFILVDRFSTLKI
jgi:signal peptidase I